MKKVSRSIGGNIFVFLIILFFGLLFFFPFLYALLQSFKPMSEIFAFPPRFFVQNPTLENYLQISTIVDSLWVPFGPVSYTHLDVYKRQVLPSTELMVWPLY